MQHCRFRDGGAARFDPTDAQFLAEEEAKRNASVFSQSGQVKPVTLRFENLSYEVTVGDKKNPEVAWLAKMGQATDTNTTAMRLD